MLTSIIRWSRKASPAIEYRKASYTKPTAYYVSYCSAAKNKQRATKWLVSVVGAPEEKAVEILNIVRTAFEGEISVTLRWWYDAPPGYDRKNTPSGPSGIWVGYDPKKGIVPVPQRERANEITLLYYSNGCDPCGLLSNTPAGEFMMYHTNRMLIPVADYIFDKESCKAVICSEYSPLYQIKTGSSRYYAPVPIMYLDCVSKGLTQRGGVKHTLGDMNNSFTEFQKKRLALYSKGGAQGS